MRELVRLTYTAIVNSTKQQIVMKGEVITQKGDEIKSTERRESIDIQ
jgi:hypothetical protein